jgi:hypothetical protein
MGTPKENYVYIGIYEWSLQKESRFDKPRSDPVDDLFFLGHSLWAWQAWRRGIHETNDSYFITAINSLPEPLREEVLEDLQG